MNKTPKTVPARKTHRRASHAASTLWDGASDTWETACNVIRDRRKSSTRSQQGTPGKSAAVPPGA